MSNPENFFKLCKPWTSSIIILDAYKNLVLVNPDEVYNVVHSLLSSLHFEILLYVLEQHVDKLLGEQLIKLLPYFFQKLQKCDNFKYIDKCCELILSSKYLEFIYCSGLPLIIATMLGLTKLIKNMLNDPLVTINDRAIEIIINQEYIQMPYCALYYACKNELNDIVKIMIERIIIEENITSVDLLLKKCYIFQEPVCSHPYDIDTACLCFYYGNLILLAENIFYVNNSSVTNIK